MSASRFQQTGGYKPRILLYDYDVSQYEVMVNYVIWETDGYDFGYNATIKEVKCNSKPVSWSKHNHDGEELTPGNYRDCFEENEEYSEFEGGEEYVIINATGANAIQFPVDGRDGVYLFNVRIVDPSFSYCDLTASFAVEVYGAPMETSLLITVIGGVSFFCCLLLLLSYINFSKKN
eukprot:TRINITY_DN960_c0_g1_i1.p1 TRINITY_DN960_c0_g1~~TRINITY_DN960_c0_g1_i1.p1  ORF type:complete len:177 (-),score=23.73 TRINITY_DN960_c0_g1_i1:15-545(-)